MIFTNFTRSCILRLVCCISILTPFLNAQENDSLQTRIKKNFLVIPALFYTPETKLGYGAIAAIYFRKPFPENAKPTTLVPSVIYTQNKQFTAGLYADHYWDREKYHGTTEITFLKYPDVLYGVGPDTPDSSLEKFTPRTFKFSLILQKQWKPKFYAGLQYEIDHTRIIERENTGILTNTSTEGSRRGLRSGLGFMANYDTRDNTQYPTSGGNIIVSFVPFQSWLGSDYSYNRIIIDARRYYPFFRNHIAAVQMYFFQETGKPPFTDLALFGGQMMMRGYRYGRYRDRGMFVTQTEYRFPVYWRFGGVIFGSYGDVAHRISDYRITDLKTSYGYGIRFAFDENEKLNLRLDFGYGKKTSGYYISIGEAF